MADKLLFLDTNALIELGKVAFKEFFYISWKTLQEIEGIKNNRLAEYDVKYKARQVAKLLKEKNDGYEVVPYRPYDDKIVTELGLIPTHPDSLIISQAWQLRKEVVFVTNDVCAWNMASQLEGLEVTDVDNLHLLTKIEEYEGVKEVTPTDLKLEKFYSDLTKNIFKCKENEYLVIKNKAKEVIGTYVWRNGAYEIIKYCNLFSDYTGKVKPRNLRQKLAFDMLQNDDLTVKVLTGFYGSGKDYLMLAHSLNMVRHGKYDKIIWIRNCVEVENSKEIGFLPGSAEEKLLPFAMVIADQVGGKEGLFELMERGQIELEHLGFVRGRTYNNSIIYLSEAENLTKEQVKLLIARVGENSVLMINGDYRQSDSNLFRNNNGLIRAIETLSGQSKFGYVKLDDIERSETAQLAELLDE